MQQVKLWACLPFDLFKVSARPGGAPSDSFLFANRDDVPTTGYKADCYEVRTTMTMEVVGDGKDGKRGAVAVGFPSEAEHERALLRLARSFLDTPLYRLELAILGFATGHKSYPPTPYNFNVGDPPIAVWNVVHRSHKEVCMKWTASFGVAGRTWMSVAADEEALGRLPPVVVGTANVYQLPVILRFGSSIWSTKDGKCAAMDGGGSMAVGDAFHAGYSRLLLAQTQRNFAAGGAN